MDVFDQLKALDEQRSKIVEEAKAEALQVVQRAIEALNALGFHYALVEGPRASAQKVQSSTAKRELKDSTCPICRFKTEPLHDGRAHRSQASKEPFTASELTERGLAKVD